MIQITTNDIDTLVLDYLLRKYPHTAYTFKNESNIKEKFLKSININLEEIISFGIKGLYIENHLNKPLCNGLYTLMENHTCWIDEIPTINIIQSNNNIEILKYNNYLITSSNNNLCIYIYLLNIKEFYLVPIINHLFKEKIYKIEIHKHILYICFKNGIYFVNLFYFFQIRGFPSTFMYEDKTGKLMQIIENSKYKLFITLEDLKESINNIKELNNFENIDLEELKHPKTINEKIKFIIENEINYLNKYEIEEENKSIILISEENNLYLLKDLNEYFDFNVNINDLEKKIAKYKLNIEIEKGKYYNSKVFIGGCKNGDLLILDCKNEKKHIFKGHEGSIYNIETINNYENEENDLIIEFQTIGKEGKIFQWILNYKDSVEIKSKKLFEEFDYSMDSFVSSYFINVSNIIEMKKGEEIIKYDLNDELIKIRKFNNLISFLNKESLIFISLENHKYFKFRSLFTDLIFLFKGGNLLYFIGTKNHKEVYLVVIDLL